MRVKGQSNSIHYWNRGLWSRIHWRRFGSVIRSVRQSQWDNTFDSNDFFPRKLRNQLLHQSQKDKALLISSRIAFPVDLLQFLFYIWPFNLQLSSQICPPSKNTTTIHCIRWPSIALQAASLFWSIRSVLILLRNTSTSHLLIQPSMRSCSSDSA